MSCSLRPHKSPRLRFQSARHRRTAQLKIAAWIIRITRGRPPAPTTNSQASVNSAKNALNLFSPLQTPSLRGFVACVSPRRPLADLRACCCAVACGGLNGRFCARISQPRCARHPFDAFHSRRPGAENASPRTCQDRRGRSQPQQRCIDRDDGAGIGRAPSWSGTNLTGAPQQHRQRNGRRASPRAAVFASCSGCARCRSAGASCRSRH